MEEGETRDIHFQAPAHFKVRLRDSTRKMRLDVTVRISRCGAINKPTEFWTDGPLGLRLAR